MHHICLHLSGLPQLLLHQKPYNMPRYRAVALLAYLVLEPGWHSRELIASLLWGDVEQKNSLVSLRSTLPALRKVLGNEIILSQGKKICLNPNVSLWVDVCQFREHVNAIRAHNHNLEDLCPACCNKLNYSLTLNKGEFMAGFHLNNASDFASWKMGQNELWQRDLTDALELLFRHQCKNELFKNAICTAQELLQIDPFNEPVHRQLMSLWDATGQSSIALEHYQQVAKNLHIHLNIYPERATTELYHQIKQRREATIITPLQQAGKHHSESHLPSSLMPFWGRETELAEIGSRLNNPNCRLLTITGPGGIGKTRLAIEMARKLVQNFEHGVYYVELSAIQSTMLLVPTIIKSVHLSDHPKETEKNFLIRYLKDKETLIVLDNFEHLLDGTPLLLEILQEIPRLKIVVTSRVALNCLAEWLYEIDGLPYPETLFDPAYDQFPAIQLFVEVAKRQQRNFFLHPDHKLAIQEICQWVGGNPLALELIASNTRRKSYTQILCELQEQLDQLSSSMWDISPRHQNIESVLTSSWFALTEEGRAAFTRLTLFCGSFTQDAALFVANTTKEVFCELHNQSFLSLTGPEQYTIHALLKQFGEQQLNKSASEKASTFARYCKYFYQLLDQQKQHIVGPNSPEALKKLSLYINDIDKSLIWILEQKKYGEYPYDLSGLFVYHNTLGLFEKGYNMFLQMIHPLEQSELHEALSQALIYLARFARSLGKYQDSDLYLEQVVELNQVADQHSYKAILVAEAKLNIGINADERGDMLAAERLYLESKAIFEKIGNRQKIIDVTSKLAIVYYGLGKFKLAYEMHLYCLEEYRQIGDAKLIATSMNNLGVVAFGMGNYFEAKRWHTESLQTRKQVGDQRGIAMSYGNLAGAFFMLEEWEQAKEHTLKGLEIDIQNKNLRGVSIKYGILGETQLIMKDIEGARHSLWQALKVADSLKTIAQCLTVLDITAKYFYQTGQVQRACEIIYWPLHHEATLQEVRDQTRKFYDTVSKHFSAAELVLIKDKSCNKGLNRIIHEVLEELSG